MRLMTLIIGIILLFSSLAAAVGPPGQVDPLNVPELHSGAYTGFIRNQTGYEVSVPSLNSGGTLVIPPYGWIEYITWTQQADVTAYYQGQPFYCLKISAHPRTYPFMCKQYDFMAEIVKPEPAKKPKPVRKKRRAKKKPVC